MIEPDEDEVEESFFAANKIWIGIGLVAVIAGGVYYFASDKKKSAPKREERIVMLSPLPPPPPPPRPTPPPVQQPQQETKPDDKKQMADESPKPDAAKPEPAKAPSDPPPSMGSNIKGDGNDGFGLNGSGNGGFVGIGGNGKGGGSPYGYYASQVKGRMAEILRQDKRTRGAAFDVKLRIWIDNSGKVTRAEAASGSDSAGAAAVLIGTRLADRPPEGMPMPLLASLSARRP